MIVRQISVFLENKQGSLSALMGLLAENQVNLHALSIADSRDFGIIRMIADNPTAAATILSGAGYICSVTEVIEFSVVDRPGGAAEVLTKLAGAGISIEYAYAFASPETGKSEIVVRVDDNEAAERVLSAE